MIQPLKKKDLKKLGIYLKGKEACNFRGPEANPEWTCYNDHRFAKAWLKDNGFDIADGLAQLVAGGAYCDCEILFNVCE